VLDDLGLLPEIRSLGRRIDRLDGRDARTGRVVLDVRYDAIKGGQHAIGVHRAAFFNVLHDAVVRAGIAVETSATVVDVERADGGGRLVREDGRRAGPFDLVVDCSGAGTSLRRRAKFAATPRAMPFGAVWATVPWPAAGFDGAALMQRYRAASVMIGVLPIGRHHPGGEELAAFFWSLPVESHAAVVGNGFAPWRDQVAGLWPETAPLLEAIGSFESLTLARYQHGTMRVAAGEGIAFVGDSAHSTSPQLGQGGNMALLDAKALAIALETSADVPGALARYAALRRWHVRVYQALSLTLTPFYQSESRALPVLRDLLVAYVAKVPPAPQVLAAMVAGNLLGPLKALGLRRIGSGG
jgi:2-polyprenyl-6-methoxyphenol hydroxylase-like FAD-dependent oxidoreductase